MIKDFTSSGIYMNQTSFDERISDSYRQTSLKITTESEKWGRRKQYPRIEEQLKEQGIVILQSESIADMNQILQGHFIVTLRTFLMLILMIVAVAGFGLAAAMNVQTAQRTKEIGVMKAMGASQRQIIKIITSESIFISLASWGIAGFLSMAFAIAGVAVFSNQILKVPLDFNILSFLTAYGIWLVLILAVGYLASHNAAKRAAKMGVKDALVSE